MVLGIRGGRHSPGLGAGGEQIWIGHIYTHIGGSCWIYNLDVDDGEGAGSIQIR